MLAVRVGGSIFSVDECMFPANIIPTAPEQPRQTAIQLEIIPTLNTIIKVY